MADFKINGTTFVSETGGTLSIDASSIDASQIKVNGTTVIGAASGFMFRNKIINGGMKISQRGTSFTFAHDGTTSSYILDRFKINLHNTDEYDCTVSQYSMTAAEINTTGHTKALKLLTGTAESTILFDEFARCEYKPEGQDVQDFIHGTASAKTATLSFWVKSSITGDFGFNIYRYVSSGSGRSINLSYTINAANTWEKKTISIVGDTGGATIPNGNTSGLLLIWQLATGSNFNSTASNSWSDYVGTRLMNSSKSDAVITTAGADWYLTGVQLEEGTVATPFEHRPIGMELSLCQRYTTTIGSGYFAGNGVGSSTVSFGAPLCVPLRAAPSIEKIGGANINIHRSGNNTNTNATVTVNAWKENATMINLRTSHNSITDEAVYNLYINNTFLLKSEL